MDIKYEQYSYVYRFKLPCKNRQVRIPTFSEDSNKREVISLSTRNEGVAQVHIVLCRVRNLLVSLLTNYAVLISFVYDKDTPRDVHGSTCSFPSVQRAVSRTLISRSSDTTFRRLQLKCDGTRWGTGGEVKGKLANGVGSQYSSHYFGTRCIQHYYRWCAQLGCQ
jgi:hypothetical protein